ncbi:hypothetical protein CHARACLAT_027686 [Characodon lateralis]|uniref:Uncharacterized protein n=1 Tax=Characodon lateralis TaxID=208331 RepID=A0ABU7E453_9TELE|nr:hypothetical protein [Characodon lateralis]
MVVVASCYSSDFCQWYRCTEQSDWNNEEGGHLKFILDQQLVQTWTQFVTFYCCLGPKRRQEVGRTIFRYLKMTNKLKHGEHSKNQEPCRIPVPEQGTTTEE